MALSAVVLQVFRRNSLAWLWLAILAHAIVDFSTVAILQLFGSTVVVQVLVELVIAAFGLAGIGVTWKLRDKPQAVGESAAK